MRMPLTVEAVAYKNPEGDGHLFLHKHLMWTAAVKWIFISWCVLVTGPWEKFFTHQQHLDEPTFKRWIPLHNSLTERFLMTIINVIMNRQKPIMQQFQPCLQSNLMMVGQSSGISTRGSHSSKKKSCTPSLLQLCVPPAICCLQTFQRSECPQILMYHNCHTQSGHILLLKQLLHIQNISPHLYAHNMTYILVFQAFTLRTTMVNQKWR